MRCFLTGMRALHRNRLGCSLLAIRPAACVRGAEDRGWCSNWHATELPRSGVVFDPIVLQEGSVAANPQEPCRCESNLWRWPCDTLMRLSTAVTTPVT